MGRVRGEEDGGGEEKTAHIQTVVNEWPLRGGASGKGGPSNILQPI